MDPVRPPVPSVETVIRIRAACAMRCTFCNRSPDRVGAGLEEALAPDFPLPCARRAVVVAGDVLRPALAPLVRRIRDADTSEVVVYAHPGPADPAALPALADAGLTGVLVLVPAADAPTLARLTRGTGSVRRLASLLDDAARLGLSIELDVPVMPETHALLAGTVRRACNRAPVRAVHLTFCAGAERGLPPPWDFRHAAAHVEAAIAEAARAGARVRLANPAPPPCVLDLDAADPGLYPVLAGTDRSAATVRPFHACAECGLASACRPGLIHFAPDPALPPVRPPDVVAASARAATAGDDVRPSSAELYLRRRDLSDLVARVSAARLPCVSPWGVLAVHDPSGGVAPCRSTLLRPEVRARTGDWRHVPLLDAWNSEGMQAVRRAIAAREAGRTCQEHCPAFFGAAPTFEPPPSLPASRALFRNLAVQAEEMLAGADRLRSLPSYLVVAPSLSCNNHCRMCHVHTNEVPRGDMPDVLFRSVLELLPVLRDLSFAGAEPLMSSRFAALVRACDASLHPDLELTLTTNGLLLDGALLRDMSRARFLQVIVSVNAATPATYERISGTPGGFERVMANVRALLDAGRAFVVRPQVVLSFVVTRSNAHEMAAFVDMARGLSTGFRLLPVEKDREGESIFTDEGFLSGVVDRVERELVPRAAALPPSLAAEVALLRSRLRFRLERREFTPL
ncbi:MAG: radical SAM protein [Deltaproteobacteria bacterium]|nr:radical SAM protein [Deltaproteobacteria bacterium]